VNVLLHTFGCKANQYDSEVVRQRLEDAGCAVVDAPEAADAAVVNSCTVTHVGDAKLRALVRRLARRNPSIRTVVMGCAAARDHGRIAALPNVAGVVGGADAEAVARALGVAAGAEPGLRRFASGSRAWLKIQDGCDEHCTFCATVLARGRSRSREPETLVREAAGLARSHAEIVLTGVHIGTYGRDRGGPPLSALVERLVERVDGVRFRLSSVEATEVDDRLIELMARAPDRLAPHLHAPLQSGSDRLLRRMGRHWYTAAGYRAAVERLAGRVTPLGLGADVMTGFPGETAADHDATRRLLETLPITYLHVFPYSEREGTAAVRLGPAVERAAARERAAELRALGAEREAAHRARRAGAAADLVLESRRGGVHEAVTEDYLTALLPADAPWVLGRSRVSARLVSRGPALWAEAA